MPLLDIQGYPPWPGEWRCPLAGPPGATPPTIRFGCITNILAACTLKFCRFSSCRPWEWANAPSTLPLQNTELHLLDGLELQEVAAVKEQLIHIIDDSTCHCCVTTLQQMGWPKMQRLVTLLAGMSCIARPRCLNCVGCSVCSNHLCRCIADNKQSSRVICHAQMTRMVSKLVDKLCSRKLWSYKPLVKAFVGARPMTNFQPLQKTFLNSFDASQLLICLDLLLPGTAYEVNPTACTQLWGT